MIFIASKHRFEGRGANIQFFRRPYWRHPFAHLWAFAATGFYIGRGDWVTVNAIFRKIHPSLTPKPPTWGGDRPPTAPHHREKRSEAVVAVKKRFCDWYARKSSAAVYGDGFWEKRLLFIIFGGKGWLWLKGWFGFGFCWVVEWLLLDGFGW